MTDIRAIRERERKYCETLRRIPGGVPTTTDQDRTDLLALLDRCAEILRRCGTTEADMTPKLSADIIALRRELEAAAR